MNQIERSIIRKLPEDFWLLIKDDAVSTMNCLNQLYRSGIIFSDDNEIKLTEKGKKIKEKYKKYRDLKCEKCDGKGILLNREFRKILKKFERLVEGRPASIPEYQQTYMRCIDAISKVAFMHQRFDTDGDILIIGDDDLISIALGLLDSGREPSRIVVVELDKRIINFINEISEKEGMNIETFCHDLRRPLPKNLRRKFDCFVTDPVTSVQGMRLFWSRGAEALKKNGVGYTALSYIESTPEKRLNVLKMLSKMGFVITDMLRDFSTYSEDNGVEELYYSTIIKKLAFKIGFPRCDWYKESLLRLVAIKFPKPLVKQFKGELYLDSDSLERINGVK